MSLLELKEYVLCADFNNRHNSAANNPSLITNESKVPVLSQQQHLFYLAMSHTFYIFLDLELSQ